MPWDETLLEPVAGFDEALLEPIKDEPLERPLALGPRGPSLDLDPEFAAHEKSLGLAEAPDVRTGKPMGWNPDDPLIEGMGDFLISNRESDPELYERADKGEKSAKILVGIKDSLRGTVESLTTPKNLLLLGVGTGAAKAGGVAAKTAGAAFMALMGKEAPHVASGLAEEYKKPPDQRDYQKLAQRWTDAATLTAGMGLAALPFLPKRLPEPKLLTEKGAPDAVPIRETEALPVETPPRSGEEVGARIPEPEKPATTETQGPDRLQTKEIDAPKTEPTPTKLVEQGEVSSIEPQRPAQELTTQPDAGIETRPPGEVAAIPPEPKPVEAKPALESGSPIGIRPENPILDKALDTVGNKSWWQKHFTAEGSLPKDVYDKWIATRGEIAAETRAVKYLTRDLYTELRGIYGISRIGQLIGQTRRIPPADVQRINAALSGEMPITDLHPRLQKTVTAMRGHIDALSKKLIDRKLIDEDLAAKVGDNFGIYVTRSYRIFDGPEWVEKIPPDIRRIAEQYLWGEMQAKNPAASVADAQVKLRELLADWSDSGLDKQMRGGKLGSKDLSLFFKRKDIAPEIRAVLGEYKDPVINYARSITKMARFIGDQEFLNNVRAKGIGEFLFEEGTSRPGFEAQLAAEGSSVMAPLNGLRTSPLIKEAFENFNRQQVPSTWLARQYFRLNAISKGAKTVGSLLTQARNLFPSQLIFNLMSGDFNVMKYGTAIKAISADIGLTNTARWRQYYQKLKSLGIVAESAKAEELRATLRDAGLRDLDAEAIDGQNWARGLRKVAIEGPTRGYQISDELGKIVGFENKKALLRKAHPERSMAEIEAEAADRVRNSYPTYSKVPNVIKQFRKQPLFGPFVSFPYEVFRTTFHNMRYVAQDARSGNPVLQRNAALHAAGIASALSAGYGLAQTSKAMLGISGRKEEDVRRFLAPWDRNAQLVFTGEDGKGGVSYINWSYQNPYSYATDPFIAMLAQNEKGVLDKSISAFGELLRPFANEQMLAAAIMDVSRNKTQTDREVYSPQDSPDDKFRKSSVHLLSALEPGSTYRLRTKIVPAATQDQPDYGRQLSLGTELTSELTGIKRQNFDFQQGLAYKARQFDKALGDVGYIFTGKVGRTGTVTDADLVSAYKDSDAKRFVLFQGLYGDTQAALRNGVTEAVAIQTLMGSGLSKNDAASIISGKYMPAPITKNTLEKAARFGRTIPGELQDYIAERYGKPLANP